MLACRAVWTSLEGRPGPVHLNFALREPLVPPAELGDDPVARAARAGARGCCARARARRGAPPADALSGRRPRRQRPVDRRGPRATPASGDRGGLRARSAGRCSPTRSAARGAGARRSRTTTRCCARRRSSPRAARPRRALRRPADVQAAARLARGARRRRASSSRWTRSAAWHDPAAKLQPCSQRIPPGDAGRDRRDAPRRPRVARGVARRGRRCAAEASTRCSASELSEPLRRARARRALAADATLFVASSMPMRDVEGFTAVRDDAPRVLCNRGANGIDGTVSSAFGAAAACPTVRSCC